MKFNIRDIGEVGIQYEEAFDAAFIQKVFADTGVEFFNEQPAHGQIKVTLCSSGDSIIVRGEITGEFYLTCVRCLNSAAIFVNEKQLQIIYMPPSLQKEELELTVDDLDTYSHDGLKINLESLIREQFLLAIPMQTLCSETCKGLCINCGLNLNHETCGCKSLLD